ncbi:UDP-galactopyranose mutase, partial [Campylobacter jejuni]|nr:UDP-galactopyranose mutase [Campylobacter jejuni]
PKSNEPYYPILTSESLKLYHNYKNLAKKINNLYFLGRLADFKYYNMDQAIKRALLFCSKYF